MPRFFFNLHNDIEASDHEGQEFHDDDAALEYAADCARDLASSSVREGHLHLSHYVECFEEGGRQVGIVRFADVLIITQ